VGSFDERMKILGYPPDFRKEKVIGLPKMRGYFPAEVECDCDPKREMLTSLAKLIKGG